MSGVLALHNGALGDLIVSLPALSALRRAYGPPLVAVGAAPLRLKLAQRPRGPIDRLLALRLDDQLALYRDGRSAPEPLRGFAAAVSFGPAPAPLRAEYRRRLHELPGFRSLRGGAADRLLVQALPRSIRSLAPARPRLSLPSEEPRRAFALHPGAGAANKRWPAESWAELAAELTGQCGPGALILGPAELDPGRPCAAAIARAFAGSEFPRETPEDPLALARILAGCEIFLGHDSGPAHLAAAIDRPCLALFGPSDPQVWAPRGARSRALLAARGWGRLSVAEVLRAASALLSDKDSASDLSGPPSQGL